MADSRDAVSELMPPKAASSTAKTVAPYPSQPSPTQTQAETRRLAPRSPRAALEPERVQVPTRWSTGARHPLVIAGNAVFTLLILVAVVGGVLFALAKHRYDAAGPLEADKIVNIPPRAGVRDIADLLVKESVIEHPMTFIVSALMAKTHDELKFGEYQFAAGASLHDVINTIVEGKVVQHQITLA